MKKRVLSVLMCLAVLAALLPVSSHADTSGKCGDDLTWSFNSATGVLTIAGSGAMRDYSGNTTENPAPWKSVANQVTSLSLSDKITRIGNRAFEYFCGLNTLTIPDSVKSIGNGAFLNCTELRTLDLGSGVKTLGDSSFAGCSGLTSITIPKSVTNLESSAFSRCTGLLSVTVENGSIGEGVFNGCTGLTSLTISKSVTDINVSAVTGCTALTGIQVNKDNKTYASVDGVLFSKDKKTLLRYPEGKTQTSYTVPDGVDTIGKSAFRGCKLHAVTLPDSLTGIGSGAFSWSKVRSITIPNGVTSIGRSAFAECTALQSIVLPKGITSIEADTFHDCISLTEITIPSGVTSIISYAFNGCSELREITIPKSVTTIGYLAFMNCTELADVYYQGTEAQMEKISMGYGSNNAELRLAEWHFSVGKKPTITAQPQAITVIKGEKATFKVTAKRATGYQWQYQKPTECIWTDVSSGGAKATYRLTAAARHNGYKYRCRVRNAAGSVFTVPVTLTVLNKPAITAQPKAQTARVGDEVTFKVKANYAESYLWQYRKPGETDWNDVKVNGTSAAYSLTAAAKHNGYVYRCKVTNVAATVCSDEAELTVLIKPKITAQPRAVTVAAGSSAAFTVAATGDGLSYRWQYQKPGETKWNNVQTNGTSATYSLSAKAKHNGYTYRCRVTNAAGTVYSKAVKLTVN